VPKKTKVASAATLTYSEIKRLVASFCRLSVGFCDWMKKEEDGEAESIFGEFWSQGLF
jgi:hypothetical protein